MAALFNGQCASGKNLRSVLVRTTYSELSKNNLTQQVQLTSKEEKMKRVMLIAKGDLLRTFYLFTNLTPGVYYLWFERPYRFEGWMLQGQGGNNSIDSDVNAIGWTEPIILSSRPIDRSWDAGLFYTLCLTIPEADMVMLFSVGLLTLAGYLVMRCRDKSLGS